MPNTEPDPPPELLSLDANMRAAEAAGGRWSVTVHGADGYVAELLREAAEHLTRCAVHATTDTERTGLAELATRCATAATVIGR